MDVAFVETGMKTGGSVDGVIPRSQRLFVRELIAATVRQRFASDPKGGNRGSIARSGLETVMHWRISDRSARRYDQAGPPNETTPRLWRAIGGCDGICIPGSRFKRDRYRLPATAPAGFRSRTWQNTG